MKFKREMSLCFGPEQKFSGATVDFSQCLLGSGTRTQTNGIDFIYC